MGNSDHKDMLYAKTGQFVRRLHQIANSVFLEEAAGFDVTPVQYSVLTAINASPGIDQIQVAHAIGLDRATVGGVVERLECKGLLARKAGELDRRTKLLSLTAAGTDLLARVTVAHARAQERILQGLSDEEKASFVAMLKRVVDANNTSSRAPVTGAALVGARNRLSAG